MPLEINLPADSESISLEEYVEAINSQNYDFSSHADLIDSAKFLKKLNNNRDFLLDKLFAELRSMGQFQKSNYYGPQVFILHVDEKYFVRANIWRPLSRVEKSIKGFQYDVCHDHNFDILTAGYFGPGYCSRAYTYDYRKITGLLGERVSLNAEGMFTLSEGRIALYRAKQDVHIQLPPEDISVSLNLIPKNEKLRELQFQFQEHSERICRYLQSSGSELIIRLAGALRNEKFLSSLVEISQNNPSPQVRALAIVAQCQISKQEAPQIASPLIRDIVQKELRDYGACLKICD